MTVNDVPVAYLLPNIFLKKICRDLKQLGGMHLWKNFHFAANIPFKHCLILTFEFVLDEANIFIFSNVLL